MDRFVQEFLIKHKFSLAECWWLPVFERLAEDWTPIHALPPPLETVWFWSYRYEDVEKIPVAEKQKWRDWINIDLELWSDPIKGRGAHQNLLARDVLTHIHYRVALLELGGPVPKSKKLALAIAKRFPGEDLICLAATGFRPCVGCGDLSQGHWCPLHCKAVATALPLPLVLSQEIINIL